MTAPTVAIDFARLFEPWRLALLSANVHLDEHWPTFPGDAQVWVQCRYPRAEPASLRRVIEAIELFILFERVDHAAWLDEVRQLAVSGGTNSWARHVLEAWPHPRLCGWRLRLNQLEDVAHVCTYLGEVSAEEDAVSAAYLEIRRVLENAIDPSEPQSISMVLDLSLRFLEWPRLWEALPSLMSLADAQTSASNESQITQLCSRFDCVGIPPAESVPVDVSVLDQLARLGRLGVGLSQFPCLGISVARENAIAVVTAVQSLLGSRASGISGRTRLATFLSNEYPLGAIESATTDATMLDHLSARCPHDDDGGGADTERLKLYWMAYALFSRDANRSVRCVELDCTQLSAPKVEVMEELLDAVEPLVLLFPDFASGIQEHKHTRLSASRFELFVPTIESDEYNPVLDGTTHRNLRVLGKVQQWWIVLLPGWGKSWVHTQDAQLSLVETPAVENVHAIERLKLFAPRDLQATIALLRLVGKNVICLHFGQFSGQPERLWTDLFNCCPNLQELRLAGGMSGGLPSVVECLPSSSAKKLARLFFGINYSTYENFADLHSILAVLSDRHHPFTRQIRGFGISSAGIPYTDTVALETCSHALRMLDANKTLQFFSLWLDMSVATAAESIALKNAFDRHQHKVLPVKANQLGVREKTAFLSVLNAAHLPRAIRKLDRGVISTILDFAPELCYRFVSFEQPRVADVPLQIRT